jgi:trehalose 2-sulfotransferase
MIPKNASIGDTLSAQGAHEKFITEHFHGQMKYDGKGAVFDEPLFIVAFTNRCGSNLLADYLRQSGLIGGLHESLNHDAVARKSKAAGVDSFPAFIRVLHDSFAAEGRLGIKASWDQIVLLARTRALAMFPSVKVIHIRRMDVISQAVSHSIAHQTKQWTSKQTASGVEPEYSFEKISTIVSNINQSNGLIGLVAHCFASDIVSVTYEDLEKSPQDCVSLLLDNLGLPQTGFSLGEPRIAKQADERNTSFINRYKTDLRARIASAK